jgi:hypothetical protein
MKTQTNTFTPTQNEAISLLIKGESKVDVAKKCSIDRSMLYRWLQRPDFKQAVYKERSDLFKSSKHRIQYLFNVGVSTAELVLRDPDNKSFARVFEIICKVVGVLDEKPQINILVLNTITPKDQIKELQQQIMERIPLLSEEEKQELVSSPIDSNDVIVDNGE